MRIDECRLRAGGPAPGDRVDREVAPGEIDLHRVAELHAMWPPVVRVVVVGAERRHLVELAAMADHHGPERVLVYRIREQLEDLIGARVGRQVPVQGGPAEQYIAQRAADNVRDTPGRPQEPHDFVDGTRDRCRERRLVGQLRPRNR